MCFTYFSCGDQVCALNTLDGIILINAMNGGQEASTLVKDGSRKPGNDPADIKYIILTVKRALTVMN